MIGPVVSQAHEKTGPSLKRPSSEASLLTALIGYAEARGIRVTRRPLPRSCPMTFDGLTAVLNPGYDDEPLCFYFAHACGSIVAWSLEFDRVAALFEELRQAKTVEADDPERLERAIADFRAFEELASGYAVGILGWLESEALIPLYTVFVRANIEAMTTLHRTGMLPVWAPFYRAWKAQVATGYHSVKPFAPKAIPPFRPVAIPPQEVFNSGITRRTMSSSDGV